MARLLRALQYKQNIIYKNKIKWAQKRGGGCMTIEDWNDRHNKKKPGSYDHKIKLRR